MTKQKTCRKTPEIKKGKEAVGHGSDFSITESHVFICLNLSDSKWDHILKCCLKEVFRLETVNLDPYNQILVLQPVKLPPAGHQRECKLGFIIINLIHPAIKISFKYSELKYVKYKSSPNICCTLSTFVCPSAERL